MYIEDIIIAVTTKNSVSFNRFDKNIVQSFTEQLLQGRGFTEKQATLAIKIISRYQQKIEIALQKNISTFLQNPHFKLGKRTVNNEKKIFIIKNEENQKLIAVTFPYNEEIVKKFRESRDSLHLVHWDPEKKAWTLSLDERSLSFLFNLTLNSVWDVDEEISNYFLQIENILKNIDNFVPLLVYKNGITKLQNKPKNTPEIQSKDILEALFQARNYGINTWDDAIQEILSQKEEYLPIKDFLNQNPNKAYVWDKEKHDESLFFQFFHYLSPALVVITVHKEEELLTSLVEKFNSCGISNNEMSVLFRLPTDTGKKFNIFVKNQHLNNPITEMTKVCFISGKLPKTVLAKNMKFNCVLNYNSFHAHYTIQELVKTHKNIINFVEKTAHKESDWDLVV